MPWVIQVEVGLIAREELGLRQPGTIVLGGVACDGNGRFHSLAQRGGREIRGAGMAALHVRPRAEVDRDADALVAIVLERVDGALAHGHREAEALRHVAFARSRAELPRMVEEDLRKLAHLGIAVGKTVIDFHSALS